MMSKNVPADVVEDILVKLPVKSLLRFRCVCKEWCMLLDCSYFESKHLEYSRTKNTSCILVKRLNFRNGVNAFSLLSETLDIVSPDIDIPLSSGYPFLGPINGIVSVRHDDKIFFCNPSTREFKALPPCNYIFPDMNVKVISTGFGYDEKNNNYKFVRIIHYKDNFHTDINKIQIYSLASNCWRNLDHITVPNAHLYDSLNGYLNGACHWYAYYFNMEYQVIMSFSLDTEVFKEVPVPQHVCSGSYSTWPTICVSSKENLSMILETGRIYEVWVMGEYGVKESWSKHYTITIGPPHFLSYSSHALPMSIRNDNELLLRGRDGKLVLYHLDTQKIRVLKAYAGDKTSIMSSFYMETLVSIKRYSGAA